MTEHAPGSTVKLDVVRNGQPTTVSVTLGQRPTSLELGQKSTGDNGGADEGNGEGGNASARGITVEPLTPEIAQQIHAPSNIHGVVVNDVDQSSTAADSGIGQGDVITSVDRKPVNSVQDFKRLMNEAQGKSALVTVNRGGQTAFIVVAAGK